MRSGVPVVVSSLFFLALSAVASATPQSTAPAQQPPSQPRAPKQGIPAIPVDKEPVITTPTGLKYCVLEKGQDGKSPIWGDRVTVHYTGWNTDGSVFDSSRNNPKPTQFLIGDVVDGLNEALLMMTPGAHWKLTVPPELGYGSRGNPPVVKPDATMIFELELVAFEKGIVLPPFHPADPSKQQKTESGMVYEPIVEGTGPAPKPDDMLELRFAVWNPKGRMLDCTEKYNNVPLKARASDMTFRVLQVAPQYMKVGSRYRFEVPSDLCRSFPYFGAPFLPTGSTTIWEIELQSATEIHLPTFVKPDPAKQTTTSSGLKYEVLTEGTGPTAQFGDVLTVRFTGWLLDGTLFDSSLLHNDTYTFQLRKTGHIAGWIEGVQLMNQGSVFRFEIPGRLGYGPKGSGTRIPPDATLVMQIEMVKVPPR